MRRPWLALLIVNTTISLVAVGWLTWIAVSPRYWFPDAYAAKGEQGNRGPQGPVGPPGPEGPVGPDAASAIDDLTTQISDLDDRVGTLKSDLSDLQDESGGRTLETDLSAVVQKVSDICDQFSSYSGALGDIYLAAC